MIRPIYLYGSNVLRKKARKVSSINEDIVCLIEDMFDTMDNAGGVGLAAPQVGVSLQVIVIDPTPMAINSTEEKELAKWRKALINPWVIESSKEMWIFEEGCLSIPGVRVPVWRPKWVKVHYRDENFSPREEILYGMVARIVLHEIDHLMGILIVDHIKSIDGGAVSNAITEQVKPALSLIAAGKVDVPYPIAAER